MRGEVKGWSSSTSYALTRGGRVNLRHRQPGSLVRVSLVEVGARPLTSDSSRG